MRLTTRIVGIYYSHSRDPRWINPAGTVVPVVKADTGRFRLFRGGSDWLTVRTKTEFILLKVESVGDRQDHRRAGIPTPD